MGLDFADDCSPNGFLASRTSSMHKDEEIACEPPLAGGFGGNSVSPSWTENDNDAERRLKRGLWPGSPLGLQLFDELPYLRLSGVEGEGLLEELERSRGVLEPIL